MRSHGVHELQASPLVVGSQQAPAVGVYVAHALQSLEEGWPNVSVLQCNAVLSDACNAGQGFMADQGGEHQLPAAQARADGLNGVPGSLCHFIHSDPTIAGISTALTLQ